MPFSNNSDCPFRCIDCIHMKEIDFENERGYCDVLKRRFGVIYNWSCGYRKLYKKISNNDLKENEDDR